MQVIYSVDERILQAKFDEGIEVGTIICKICNYINFNEIKFNILPSLIKIMVKKKREKKKKRKRHSSHSSATRITFFVHLTAKPSFQVWKKHINEAVDLLFELYYTSSDDTDYSAITWYYALCLEFLLDASMNLESYSSCNKFYIFISKLL